LQNLGHVQIGVKFSQKFTLEQVTARWKSLFLDEKASFVSNIAIKKLHPIVKGRIRKAVLFSSTEEDLIKRVDEVHLHCFELFFWESLKFTFSF